MRTWSSTSLRVAVPASLTTTSVGQHADALLFHPFNTEVQQKQLPHLLLRPTPNSNDPHYSAFCTIRATRWSSRSKKDDRVSNYCHRLWLCRRPRTSTFVQTPTSSSSPTLLLLQRNGFPTLSSSTSNRSFRSSDPTSPFIMVQQSI